MFKDLMREIRRPIIRTVGNIASYSGKARTPDGRLYDVPRGMNGIDYVSIFRGRYEQDETRILDEYFAPDDTIIEIGSNIGGVSCAAFGTKLKDGGKIICVEANPRMYPYLKSNLARMQSLHPQRKYEVIEAAIGSPQDDGKKLQFNLRGHMTSGLTAMSSGHDEGVVDVPVVSLSSLVAKHAPNGYSLICDVEGAEIAIITQDPQAFATCRQIAMELHHPELTGRPETPVDMILKLQSLGFTNIRQMHDTYYFSR